MTTRVWTVFGVAAGLLAASGGATLAGKAEAAVLIAEGGQARCVIYVQPGATAPERYAAEEMARWLKEATGGAFPVRSLVGRAPSAIGALAATPGSGVTVPENAIVVGQGWAARQMAPDVDFAKLDGEETLLRAKGTRLLVAGGRPRGTLYAAYRFLQNQVGVRWWTPWATDVPKRPTLTVAEFDAREKPAFESRDPYWYSAFDGDWAARNASNSARASLSAKHGGKIVYKGFVHTFYPLVPPEQYFAPHPEWYSEINGKRTTDRAQLCTTNPALREFIVQRVREWLKESPEASIVSISQNDWFGACTCPVCKALDNPEGSHSASVLTLVNYVAEKLGPEFPGVAFDTLAYQYTRKAPKTLTPRENVIVRLCSIECNFREPLEAKANQSFGDDLRAWSKKSRRLYVWDYTTNFAHYDLPHPNWFALGPNVRFFHKNGVRGLFEQGAHQSTGSEMGELRAWVLAQLLWNPFQDDEKLIDTFLDGYYGKPSGRLIRQYMDLLWQRSQGWNLTCYSPTSASFLNFATLAEAERLWQAAEKAATAPDKRWRVRQGHNAVRYAFLAEWARLRRECRTAGGTWPLPESAATVAQEWLAVATGTGDAPPGWPPMTHVNEGGLTPEEFAGRFVASAEDRSPLPADLAAVLDLKGAVQVQEREVSLANRGTWAEIRPDPPASNERAVWMPATHHEWAYQIPFHSLPEKIQEGRWRIYAVVRLEKGDLMNEAASAWTMGVYDTAKKASVVQTSVLAREAASEYRSYPIGLVRANPDLYVWVAPTTEAGEKSVWVDSLVFVPASAAGQ